jgi:glycosyltransferase involved in cell wall biosynthesis
MRQYDFRAAQRVDYFIANSQNVARRIKKFYRREARVIYPPIDDKFSVFNLPVRQQDYYLVVSRIVGGKGLELAIKAANKMGFKLKIAGTGAGWGQQFNHLKQMAGKMVEFVGQVSDQELVRLYAEAKGFLALAEDEDFGITPVEAMQCGTPVIAFRGGGYVESVVEGKTGVFFDQATVKGLSQAIKKFEAMEIKSEDCVRQARKFSKERFKREIKDFVLQKVRQA